MSTIVTRAGKGSALTNDEVDANFTNLNADKIQVTGTPTDGYTIVWDSATSTWVPELAGAGVPAGGSAGQVLSKVDGTDYNTNWIDNYATQVKLPVKNATGSTIAKGKVVYVSGATGANALISLAKADSDSTSATTIGFVDSTLATGDTGLVVVEGVIAGIDTSAATEGDPVWLSPTTAGEVLFGMANKPVAPAHMVYLGVVTRAHATQGEIQVKTQNGYELDELHNVAITSPANLQLLTYDSTAGVWKNSALGSSQVTSALGFTPYDASNPDSYITAAALSGYLTSATAASTYQTISGMSSYLTTATAASTYAALAGATFTGDVGLTDSALSRAMLKDTGWKYFDSTTTNALDYTNGSHQRWAPATGAQTLSITNWPPSGNLGELLIEGINLGAATITWPTINWVKSDGTTTTTFGSNGVTLQTSGTDWVYLWTRDGTTIYGKVVR